MFQIICNASNFMIFTMFLRVTRASCTVCKYPIQTPFIEEIVLCGKTQRPID